MKNLTLSPSVKQYFVHALKGLGLRNGQEQNGRFVELSEAEIARMLDDQNTDGKKILAEIEYAFWEQLKIDNQSGQYLRKRTAFDSKTAQSILGQVDVNGLVMGQAQGENYLHNVTHFAQNNDTIEKIIMALCAGVSDKKLTNDEKDEALAVWDEIHYAGFKEWLGNQYQPQLYAAWLLQERSGKGNSQSYYSRLLKAYRIAKVETELLNETISIFGASNGADARKFLEYKIYDKNNLQNLPANKKANIEIIWQKLDANPELRKSSQRFCQARCEAKGLNPETEFSVKDVLAAVASNSSAQLLTFFNTRSAEQEIQQKTDPKNSGVTKENKIGNVMGDNGRAFVKSATGGVGAAVAYDSELGLKKGKSGPWRGYKELFDRITKFLQNDIYSNIPVIGFVQGMMERKGYGNFDPKGADYVREEVDLTKAWQTEYKPIASAYKDENGELNAAGEFINTTRARILADKMAVAEKTAQIQDCDSNIDIKATEEQVKYLQERIKTAEKILKEQIPTNPKSDLLNNSGYYQMLEGQIIAKETNQDNPAVKNYLDQTNADYTSANIEMKSALQTFERMVKTPHTTDARCNALHEMAADVFNLRSRYESGEITGADLDDMTSRFVNTPHFNQMLSDLDQKTPNFQAKMQYSQNISIPNLDSKDYVVTADQVATTIDAFVKEDLVQNAKYEEYNRYQAEQYHEQFRNEALREM